MILHFSAYLCARGVRGTRNRNVLRAGAMKAISGMVLAGDLACLRIGSSAAAPVATARVEFTQRERKWGAHIIDACSKIA
jgi:hypothetical protein